MTAPVAAASVASVLPIIDFFVFFGWRIFMRAPNACAPMRVIPSQKLIAPPAPGADDGPMTWTAPNVERTEPPEVAGERKALKAGLITTGRRCCSSVRG